MYLFFILQGFGCVFTRDGRIILAIRLISVTKITIYVTGG